MVPSGQIQPLKQNVLMVGGTDGLGMGGGLKINSRQRVAHSKRGESVWAATVLASSKLPSVPSQEHAPPRPLADHLFAIRCLLASNPCPVWGGRTGLQTRAVGPAVDDKSERYGEGCVHALAISPTLAQPSPSQTHPHIPHVLME